MKPLSRLTVAMVGLGCRGDSLLYMLMCHFPEIDVAAVCDRYPDRQQRSAQKVVEFRGHTPFMTDDYHEILNRREALGLDCILIATSWESHIPLCIDAMNAGIPVGCEVGGAHSVEECWELIRTYERTKSPVMLLENCCYGQEELTVFNMVKMGLFGEIVHCEGGYRHDLRDEITEGEVNRHYRRENYRRRNGELYPTHALGPIAKCLNINRGNRMLSLCAMSSKAAGLQAFNKACHNDTFPGKNDTFAQGDIVTTMIKCAGGETITLCHDTSLPRPYSRGNLVQGTEGIWSEDKRAISLSNAHRIGEMHDWTPLSEYEKKYMHPLWRSYHAVGGHDGIDFLVFQAFFDAVRNKTPMPIDVYDMAAWMVITPLSEDSCAMGSMPVAIPDFTNGKWLNRAPFHRSRYCLDDICEEQF